MIVFVDTLDLFFVNGTSRTINSFDLMHRKGFPITLYIPAHTVSKDKFNN